MAASFAKYTRVAMIYSSYRMKLTLLIIAVCALDTNARATKKSLKDVVSYPETKSKFPKTVPKPAIIAIEIVDPNENITKPGKAKKRTIESALGYGYNNHHNNYPKPPRYEVYKYSQRDIPPYHGPPIILPQHNYNNHRNKGDYEISKSVEYDLGTKSEFIPAQNLNKFYQPGTTLFSMIDQNGHVGSLTQQAPQNTGPSLPVIVLRVHPSQLTHPGALHANIPQGSPYSYLNGVDLQKLLTNHIQSNHRAPQNSAYQHEQNNQNDGLLTHENYPDDKHTKVVFNKGLKQKIQQQKFKISVPPNTFSKVIIQDHSYQQQQPPQQLEQPIIYNYNHQGRYYQQPNYEKVTYQQQYNYHQPRQENPYQQYQNYLPPQYTQQYSQVPNHQQQSYQVTHPYSNQQNHYQQQEPQTHYQQQDPQNHYQQQEPRNHYQQQESPNHYQQHQTSQEPQEYYQHNQQPEEPQNHYQQPPETQYEEQSYYNQGEQPAEGYSSDNYDPTNEQVREGEEDHDYNLHEISKEAGRDLHSKVYNYHATEEPHAQQTESKRTVSVPLVLAPHVRKEIIEEQQGEEE